MSFAGVASDGAAVVVHRKGDPALALARLESRAEEFAHLIGHNILRFDLPHLVANRPWTAWAIPGWAGRWPTRFRGFPSRAGIR
ncbi:hypothetical protein ACFQBU_17885 [Jhaorihella thermophila]